MLLRKRRAFVRRLIGFLPLLLLVTSALEASEAAMSAATTAGASSLPAWTLGARFDTESFSDF